MICLMEVDDVDLAASADVINFVKLYPVLPDDIFKIPQLEARNPPKIMVFCRKTPKISNK
jgi:hypothetical protein